MNTVTLDYHICDANGSARGPVSVYLVDDAGKRTLVFEDTCNLASAKSREKFQAQAKTRAGKVADPKVIETLMLQRLQELREAPPTTAPAGPAAGDLLADTPADVKAEALARLTDPDIIKALRLDFLAMGIAGKADVALGAYVVGTSRLLDRPAAAIVRGASSSGKSYEVATVGKLFPPESKVEAHAISPKALYYLPDGALEHRFVIAGERSRRQDDDAADATKALREMISDGVLRAVVTETVDGRLAATPFEKRGPIAFIESTSATTIFAEDLNRCIILDTDESEGQTRNIIVAAALAAAGRGGGAGDVLIPIHHAMQRMLNPVRVRVPYALKLAKDFPAKRVEARRALPHLLGLIQAVGMLRQFQKPAGDFIEADAQDYAVALDIVRPTLGRLTGAFDQHVKHLWDEIQEHAKGEDFTATDAAAWTGVREADARGRLYVLAEQTYLVETQEHRGNKPAKFKVNPKAPAVDPGEGNAGLPSADEIEQMLVGEGAV